MSAMIRGCCALSLAWLLTACPPWPGWEGCEDASCESTSTPGSTGETSLPTTGGSFQTVTGGDGSSSGGVAPETGTSEATTAADPDTDTDALAKPPEIVDVALTPDPITFNGAIAAVVSAEHADGVRMVLHTEDVIELVEGEPGVFGGEIPVLSSSDNGEHKVWLTPWRGAVEGAEVEEKYVVALPLPGSQVFWEIDDSIGPGQVEALGVLPDGDVVEFGTHHPNGASRCYLRRRDRMGVLRPNAFAAVLPGSECAAVDLKVDANGAMFVLVNRPGPDGLLWWMAKIPAWGLGATKLGAGVKGETGVALAHHEASGTVAVCGSALMPAPATDIDAMVQVFRPNQPVEPWTLDHQPAGKDAHLLDERTRDCVFEESRLALVGEMYGRHDDDNVKRDRLFTLRLDLDAKSPAWLVAPAGVRTQSGAQAADVDDQGRLVVAGYTCDDVCQPEGDLRIYDPKDTLVWQVSLGAFETKSLITQDLAWSPAGYAVVATGGLPGNESAFTVRAFAQSQVGPLWTFAHKDIQVLDLALALVIGRYGEVYAGGLGANGYPAVAVIGG